MALEDEKKPLFQTNKQAFDQLSQFRVVLKIHIHWQRRNKYLTLIKEFLDAEIEGPDFTYIFTNMYVDI